MWEGVVKFQVLLMTRRDSGALGVKRHHQDSRTAVEAWSGNQVSELRAFGGQTHGILFSGSLLGHSRGQGLRCSERALDESSWREC